MTSPQGVATPRPTPPAAASDDELTTLALTALTVVTAISMARLFTNLSFLGPVLAAAIAAHVAAWGVRQARLPTVTAVALPLAAGALVASWFVLLSSTFYGIPYGRTWHVAYTAIQAARADFSHAVAPVVPTAGYVLAAMVGITLVATIGDWAAFRVGSGFEAVVPAFSLFLLTAILGQPRHRWLSVAAELAAALVFLAVHGARSRSAGTPWFASRSAAPRVTLLQGTAALAAIAVLAAVLIGPRLPGADAAGLLDWRNRDDDGAGRRTTISPLVDIRGRLVEKSTTEAFSVRSTARAYWRLTALDTFDGAIWSSNDNYRRADGSLPAAGPRVEATEIVQSFAISGLSSIWLPAAFRPTRIGNVKGVSYNSESGSLISRESTSDGLTYTVVSERPALTAAGLAGAPELGPGALAHHLELPRISPRVRALAERITAGHATPYARARALQDHLRTYRYDLGVDQGHADQALERFLFVTRRGYCEQFSAAYAVMARLVGLPSRVAVGFTPGEPGPDNTFRVLGLHAHAWPEVWINGYGWVAFEPTPGRGAPGAQDYTGVPEAQASIDQPSVATTAAPTSTVPAGGPASSTTTAPAPPPLRPLVEPDRRRLPGPLLLTTLVVLLAAAGWAVAVPAVRRSRRMRRRAAARTAAERVLVAWAEADEALGLKNARRRPSETLQEHARRVRRTVPDGARAPLVGLAAQATEASYAETVAAESASSAIAAAAQVESEVNASVGRARRLRRELTLR